MLDEVLAALKPTPGGRYADGTLGGGGHAAAILRASSPTGWLYGCDRDGMALAAAGNVLAEFSGRYELRQADFATLADWIPPGTCDGVLLDLGVSSPQLDEASRGFSVRNDGPLDMRFDQRAGVTAAELVNSAPAAELARLFWELGGERESRRLARAIVEARAVRPIATTGELAQLIERRSPRSGSRIHPATKVFQALRMAVNDELGSLAAGLTSVWKILKPGGRLAVLTFHSGEVRLVRRFGRALERDYEITGEVDVPELRRPRPPRLCWVSRRAIEPSASEIAANPRSRSAQLRVMEKLTD